MSDHYNFGQPSIKLSKSEMLFIRACKMNDTSRLLRLRNRIYLSNDSDAFCARHLSTILVDICEKLKLITLSRLVHEMRDVNRKRSMFDSLNGEQTVVAGMEECIVEATRYAIRYAPVKKLGNLVSPRRFRRDEIKKAQADKLAKIYTESNSGI